MRNRGRRVLATSGSIFGHPSNFVVAETASYVTHLKVRFHHRVIEHNFRFLAAHEKDLLDHPAFVAEQRSVVNAEMKIHISRTPRALFEPIGSSNQPYCISGVTVGILLANAGYVVCDAHVEAVLDNLHSFIKQYRVFH